MSGLLSVWIWYSSTVGGMVLISAGAAVGGSPGLFAAIHAAVLLAALVARSAAQRLPGWGQRWLWGGFTIVALPVVFSSIGLVLPALHPEPYEWLWIALDRWLLGTDPTVAVQAVLTPWFTELLQWVYASFYLLPCIVIVFLGVRRDADGFDRSLLAVSVCFLLSYLGYFLWPTLPPYRFLEHQPLSGVWLFDEIHASLDRAELNRWDCFPSGHTLVSLLSLWLAWRYARVVFWPLLPVVVLLVISTVALRYHYVSDVLAGALLLPPGLWLSGRLHAAFSDQ